MAHSEYSSGHGYESEPALIALDRLASNLQAVDSGIALESSMHEYLVSGLGLNERQADSLWLEMRQVVGLDDELLYDCPSLAIGYCQTLLVTQIMSTYKAIHTADNFKRWLPKALRVAISTGGNHTSEVCPREWEGFDTMCNYGCCPIKSLAQAIDQEVYGVDFESLPYLLDPATEYRNIDTLLRTARQFLILSEGDESRLRGSYERRLVGAFSPIGNSTLRTDEKPV